MLLAIDDNVTISDLQDRFNECFSNLKIEFYDARHKWRQGSSEAHKLRPEMKLCEIRRNHNQDIFEIKSWYKAGRVEQELRDVFGLYAQIFFKKGSEWVQSLAADDLTLAQLNEQGNDLSKKI